MTFERHDTRTHWAGTGTAGTSKGSAGNVGVGKPGMRLSWRPSTLLAVGCACAFALAAPAAVAQDAGAPPKVKTVKPKAVAKEKAPDAEEGDAKQAAPVKRDPAQAQRTFDNGVKLLQAGKAEPAVQAFSSVISGGNLPPQIMAKALHQRGIAYRATGKPAQAVSDLTSALWLKGGLTDVERADASQQRSAAYREAGLPDQSDPAEAKGGARRTAAPAPSASAQATAAQSAAAAVPAVTTASLAPEPQRAAAAQSSPLGTLFGNLFGSGSSSQAAAVAPSPAPAQPPQPATSGWSSATTAPPATAPAVKSARVAAAVAPPTAAAVAPTAPVAPAKATPAGGVHARMITRSEAEASTLASRLQKEFAPQMSGRSPAVSQAQFGGMGSFFQVRVGPYKTPAEAQAFCAQIKSAGADCVAVTQ